MPITRVRDVAKAVRGMRQLSWAATNTIDAGYGTLFYINGTATSGWTLNITNVPTVTDEGSDFVMEFVVVYSNGSSTTYIPSTTVFVNGTAVTATVSNTVTTTFATVTAKYVVMRRSNTWYVYGYQTTSLPLAF